MQPVTVFTIHQFAQDGNKENFLSQFPPACPKGRVTQPVYISMTQAPQKCPHHLQHLDIAKELPLNRKAAVNAWSHTELYIWDDDYDNSAHYWWRNSKDGLCRLPDVNVYRVKTALGPNKRKMIRCRQEASQVWRFNRKSGNFCMWFLQDQVVHLHTTCVQFYRHFNK